MDDARMNLWNQVCETDPRYTKEMNFGRKFTAIDAQYQIRRATEQFGPAGKGWGWTLVGLSYPPDCVVVHIRLWWGKKNQSIDAVGQCKLANKNKVDEDATKKALTDAITKGLSYFGFNADVFENKFADNKYVERMRKKFDRAAEAKLEDFGSPRDMKREILDDLWVTKSWAEAKEVWDLHRQKLTILEKHYPEDFKFIKDEFGTFTEKFDDHPVKGKAA